MLQKVISGGQTGVDRGALEAALRRGFPCGGCCPKGRRAEDGPIPARFPLTELDSTDYLVRTRRNVADADATLILASGTLTGGTRATETYARRAGKPCLVVDPDAVSADEPDSNTLTWLVRADVRILNVAGPRESSCPGIAASAEAFVGALLDALSSSSPS